MKRIIATVALLAVFAAPSASVFAATGHAAHKSPPKHSQKKKVVSAVCPVMGTKIPDITKAAGKSVYNGKTYYFCCAGCKPAFDKDPEKYIKK
jgi:YHS domain-containing protein